MQIIRALTGLRFVVAFALALFAVNLSLSTAAQAETRSLKLYYLHTGEKATITFKKNGKYIKSGLRKLNRFLRDWRRNEPTKMDPRLFDLIWEVYKETRSRKYIHVISGFRSLKTNNLLRKRGRGVAKRSQHTQGRALDFFIPGVSLKKLRAIGLRKGIGGVGYYPRSGSPFVHMDTGRIRHWPRMTRRQLKKVFPRGGTVHVPTDGKPLPGYKQALAAAKRRKSGKAVYTAGNSSNSSNNKSLLSRLFNPGGGSDEEEDNQSKTSAPRQVKSVPVAKPNAKNNAIAAAIEAENKNPTIPDLNSVPLPKFAPRQNPVEETPKPLNGNSAIGDLIAAIPTPRPGDTLENTPANTIDRSIAADTQNPIVEDETASGTALAALAPNAQTPKNTIASRIENALLASDEGGENFDESTLLAASNDTASRDKGVPFQQKAIDVEREQERVNSKIAALQADNTAGNTIDNSADDTINGNLNVVEKTGAETVAELQEENPLLKDRDDIEIAQTELPATHNAPLPTSRPSDDEVIYNNLVSQLEQKRSAYDVAISEEAASIPDLKMGDLARKDTMILGFQAGSIAEVALMRAPAYGQNMIKLAPSRILKGGFHNDFDIAPTNRFAVVLDEENLALKR